MMNETIEILGREYHFERPIDLEALWDQMDENDFCADERLPYWVEIWPASIFLARWIKRNRERITNAWCLDLGCGLGLSTSVASEFSGNVLGLDYEFSALSYAEHNARRNHCPAANWALMDWRHPALKSSKFSFIWGADILYETRFFEPLIRLFREQLAPGGIVWLSSPIRKVSDPFWNMLKGDHWRISLQDQESIAYKSCSMQVCLWEVQRRPA